MNLIYLLQQNITLILHLARFLELQGLAGILFIKNLPAPHFEVLNIEWK